MVVFFFSYLEIVFETLLGISSNCNVAHISDIMILL
jgi:hypothetical protein